MIRAPLAPWALALLLPLTASAPRSTAAATPAAAPPPPSPGAAATPAAGTPGTAGATAGPREAAAPPPGPETLLLPPRPAAPVPPPDDASSALPVAPVNLDFEDGDIGQMPPGWIMTAASQRAGFGADLTDEGPFHGQSCAVVRSVAYGGTPGTGTMMQTFAAGAYRGQRVRFRAAVRAAESRAQLFLAVERPNQVPGFFDNMADRPVTSNRWQIYDIVGEVPPDATRISIGISMTGDGRAWIDAGSFEILGPVHDAPPRALGGAALTDLVAFARLLGYVRYFHPSDQAAATDWGAFATAAVADLDPDPKAPAGAAGGGAADQPEEAPVPATATTTSYPWYSVPAQATPPAAGTAPAVPAAPAEGRSLAAALQRLFTPIAPTVRVFLAGSRPPSLDLGPPPAVKAADLRVVGWRHTGLGVEARPSPFFSKRVELAPGAPEAADLDPRQPFAADLGGGAASLVPLAVWADAAGTLPRVASAAMPAAATPVAPATDRSSRLAMVILTWNALQHFDPGLTTGGVARAVAWQKALPAALRAAAETSGTESLLAALRRMVAATDDGQATVSATANRRGYSLPLHWDWIEGQLVLTEVAPGVEGLHPGDAVTRIEGRPARAEVTAAETDIAAATPQWRRLRALANLALGERGEPVRLDVEPAATAPAAAHAVTVTHGVPTSQSETTAKQEPIREAKPGVLVVDLSRLSDRDLTAALPRLAAASGIVFDLRGAARSTDLLLAHLVTAPVDARREQVPVWNRPDREGVHYLPVEATVAPAPPRLQAKLAFLSGARDIGVAESFLATVAELHLGPIVGAPTGGASGNVDSEPLPAGFSILWTGTRPAPGAPPAGTPVAPTVAVAPTRAGLAAGRDEVLEKALSLVTPSPAASAR